MVSRLEETDRPGIGHGADPPDDSYGGRMLGTFLDAVRPDTAGLWTSHSRMVAEPENVADGLAIRGSLVGCSSPGGQFEQEGAMSR